MLVKTVILLGVVSLSLGLEIPKVKTTETFSQSEILDSKGDYILFWNYNDTHVTFEVHVKTKETVTVTNSLDHDETPSYSASHMDPNCLHRMGWSRFVRKWKDVPGDVAVGWVSDDGTTHFSDRHTTGHTMPIKDTSQDWHLLYGEENDFGTLLKFVRRIDTCDSAEDMVIPQGTTRLIYAFGTADPSSDDAITYHGQSRGTKSVALLSTILPKNMPTDVKSYDFFNQNFLVPAKRTTYWCIGFQMPDIGKHHLIKYEPVITPGNEQHVHHILLYRCKGINPAISDGARGDCYVNRPHNLPPCGGLILAWGIGGKPFYFPEHVGFSVGAHDDASFYIMETHYDNPTRIAGMIDDSGLRFTLTKTLRPQEAGLLEMGTTVNYHQYLIVPPLQEAFVTKGYCSADCIRDSMASIKAPKLKIFSLYQHAHVLAVAIATRHYRNGTELEPLLADLHYDFNYQENRVLPKERHVYPGDSFRVDCTYDSRKRSQRTFGGLSTKDEMCLAFAYYYPRAPAVNCTSSNTFSAFHISSHQVYNYAKTSDWTNKTFVRSIKNKLQQSTTLHRCHGEGFATRHHDDIFLEKDDQVPYVAPPPDCN